MPIAWIVLLAACSGRSSGSPASGEGGTAFGATVGVDASDAMPSLTPSTEDLPMTANTLDRRLDLELRPDVATVIAALDLTVTLVSAERLRVGDAERGVAHVDRVVVRFERGGEAPVEVVFGRGQRVHRLYGVGFAVFGGTVLSVFPPGVHVMP